jgi:hypothetical protein
MSADQWSGQYFNPRKGAVANTIAILNGDRNVYKHFGDKGQIAPKWYVDALASAMSTIFSAIGSYWQVWRIPAILRLIPVLKGICEEYEVARVLHADLVKPTYEEVYVACLLRLGMIRRFAVRGDFSYEEKAREVAEEVLANEDLQLSTRILLHARHAMNPATHPTLAKIHEHAVRSELRYFIERNLSPEELELEVGQGYKTLCRVGRIIKFWWACRVSLQHDKSKDLWLKTLVLPGYQWYLVKYFLRLVR